MKFYETHYEDYIHSVEKYNLHPELVPVMKSFPSKINRLENLIVYGPAGVGKYSQVLTLLKKYSPSVLKYDKKITAQTDKQQYIYRMSDIHYEIDMSLLGCNSKLLWHEIFFQIVDIISVKQEKIGIILCKNFHLIHTELLEIFYSYMQHYNHTQASIKIKFVLITEHVSFLPTPIVNACHIINVGRPSKDKYEKLAFIHLSPTNDNSQFLQRITNFKNIPFHVGVFAPQITTEAIHPIQNQNKIHPNIFEGIDLLAITNIKEVRSFPLLVDNINIPKDIFNIICDNIIKEILSPQSLTFTGFRDTLYDILTYNLDTTECLWYILSYFIENKHLADDDISDILIKSYTSLKYYNNNYRPIYHLESMAFTIINKIHKYNEL